MIVADPLRAQRPGHGKGLFRARSVYAMMLINATNAKGDSDA